jgi:hypothetical protein
VRGPAAARTDPFGPLNGAQPRLLATSASDSSALLAAVILSPFKTLLGTRKESTCGRAEGLKQATGSYTCCHALGAVLIWVKRCYGRPADRGERFAATSLLPAPFHNARRLPCRVK